MSNEIIEADDPRPEVAGLFGGKAGALARARRNGFTVPPFFILPMTTLEKYFSANHSQPITGFVGGKDKRGPMDLRFQSRLTLALQHLTSRHYAIRSSAGVEDGMEKSYAGQFSSFLNVSIEHCEQQIFACWQSRLSPRVSAYGKRTPVSMAVIVQEMIDAEISGVCFSRNPLAMTDDTLIIESVHGLAESLVQGSVTPDHYVINRSSGDIEQTILGYQSEQCRSKPFDDGCEIVPLAPECQSQPTMKPELKQQLAIVAHRAESVYATPVDIEWAWKDQTLHVLQIRPITARL